MRARHGKLDVAHALSSHRRLGHLNPAPFAYHALVSYFSVLAAVALKVLFRAKNAFVKKAVFFRPLRAVIDGFGLGHLSVGPRQNIVWRSKLYSQ
jgi:hypothetical protein